MTGKRTLLHEDEARSCSKAREMTAFLGDINIASFIDAQEIGNRVAWRNRSDGRSIAGAQYMHVRVWDEECARAKHGLEPSWRVGLRCSAKDMSVPEFAGRGRVRDEIAKRRVPDEEIVDRHPGGSDRRNAARGRPARSSSVTIEGKQPDAMTIACKRDDNISRHEGRPLERGGEGVVAHHLGPPRPTTERVDSVQARRGCGAARHDEERVVIERGRGLEAESVTQAPYDCASEDVECDKSTVAAREVQ